MNRVFLLGNLTRSPQLRYTPKGVPVADFGMAVNRRRPVGDQQETTCFIDVICTDALAVRMHAQLRKGMPAFIEGRLRMERWQTREGQNKARLKVVAESIQLLDESAADRSDTSAEGDF